MQNVNIQVEKIKQIACLKIMETKISTVGNVIQLTKNKFNFYNDSF